MSISILKTPLFTLKSQHIQALELCTKITALAVKVITAAAFTTASIIFIHILPFNLVSFKILNGATTITLQCLQTIGLSALGYAAATLYLDHIRVQIPNNYRGY